MQLCRIAAPLFMVLTMGLAPEPFTAGLARTQQLKPGAQLRLRVTGAQNISVQSELGSSSARCIVDKDGTIPVGKVDSPGLYFVTLQPDPPSDHAVAVLPLLVGQAPDGTFSIAEWQISRPADSPSRNPASVNQGLWQKFWSGLTADRLKSAADKVSGEWLGKHAVDATTIVIVCILPGGQAECGKMVLGQASESGLDILEMTVQLMEKDKVLTTEEANLLLTMLRSARGVADTALATGVIGKVASGLHAIAQTRAAGRSVEVLTGYSDQLVKKYQLIIKVAQPK